LENPEDGGAPADVPELTEHRIRSKAAVDPEVRALAADFFPKKAGKRTLAIRSCASTDGDSV